MNKRNPNEFSENIENNLQQLTSKGIKKIYNIEFF